MVRIKITETRRAVAERRRRYILAHSNVPPPPSDSSSSSNHPLPPPPGVPARMPPPPPEMLTRLRVKQMQRNGFRVTFYAFREDVPLLIPPPTYESDSDFNLEDESVSDSEATSDSSPPVRPPGYIHAPTSQTDSSERSFWQKQRDALLEQATGLEEQASDLFDKADDLQERAEALREMAADLERGGPVYSDESW